MSLRAGVCKVCITPPLGILLGGDFVRPPADSVHDDLWARCLFLENDGARLALVTCDLVGMRYSTYDRALEILRSRLGLRADEFVLNCTHSHSGPDVPAIIETELDHPYINDLPRLIADAVIGAADALQPARAGVATGSLTGVCVNRRIRVRGGRVVMNWRPVPEEEIVGYGPIDPDLGVLRIDDAEGKPIAGVVHYTCHAAVVSPFPRQISADFPGYTCRMVERLWGDGAMAMFVNGAFGDINHILDPGQYTATNPGATARPFEEAERVGQLVAAKALELLPNVETRDVPIGTAAATFTLNLRKPWVTDMAQARENLRALKDRVGPEPVLGSADPRWDTYVEMVYAEHAVRMLEGPDQDEMRLGAFRIGDLGVAYIPCETFVETGFAIKNASPFATTWVTGITPAYTGYLPTEESFPQGAYEVRPCCWSKWAENTDKIVVRESSELLRKLVS